MLDNKIKYLAFYGSMKDPSKVRIYDQIKSYVADAGECTIPGELYDIGRIPGIKPGKRPVRGRLFRVLDFSVLDVIDKYERTDNEDPQASGYSRHAQQLIRPKVTAWVYYYDGSVSDRDLITQNSWTYSD
jgi:gamma-glutamylcyclotransferase (GGCT)/AIG2-like uncharacterized protein YtfP